MGSNLIPTISESFPRVGHVSLGHTMVVNRGSVGHFQVFLEFLVELLERLDDLPFRADLR